MIAKPALPKMLERTLQIEEEDKQIHRATRKNKPH